VPPDGGAAFLYLGGEPPQMGEEKVLNECFAAAAGGPVETEMGVAYQMFEREVWATQRLRVQFESASEQRPQGIVLKHTDGQLEIDGDRAREFALWQERAPSTVDVVVGADGWLRAWNVCATRTDWSTNGAATQGCWSRSTPTPCG